MLVDVADDKLRQRLDRDGNEVFEAGHKQRRQHLVHGYNAVRQLAAAQPLVVGQHQRDLPGQAVDDAVHIHVGDLQLLIPEALKQSVDKRKRAQIGAHPPVLPEALQNGDGRGDHHFAHGQQVIEPRGVVHERVLHATPFPIAGDAGLVLIAAAQTALSVGRLPLGVKPLQLLIEPCDRSVCQVFQLHSFPSFSVPSFLISRLSTKA